MHFCGTCPSIIWTHSTPYVTHTRFTHTWGQVPAKILYPNPTPMHGLFTMGRANKEREREREREREITRLSCFHQSTTDQGNCSTNGCCNLQVHHKTHTSYNPLKDDSCIIDICRCVDIHNLADASRVTKQMRKHLLHRKSVCLSAPALD
jgi:hypothetical protein